MRLIFSANATISVSESSDSLYTRSNINLLQISKGVLMPSLGPHSTYYFLKGEYYESCEQLPALHQRNFFDCIHLHPVPRPGKTDGNSLSHQFFVRTSKNHRPAGKHEWLACGFRHYVQG